MSRLEIFKKISVASLICWSSRGFHKPQWLQQTRVATPFRHVRLNHTTSTKAVERIALKDESKICRRVEIEKGNWAVQNGGRSEVNPRALPELINEAENQVTEGHVMMRLNDLASVVD